MTVSDLAFPPAPVTEFLSLPRAVLRFGVDAQGKPLMTRKSLEAIALSGVLDAMTGNLACQIGTTGCVVVSEPGIRALARAPFLNLDGPHERIVNVRVKPAAPATDAGRHYVGWHASMGTEEAALGVTRWWVPPKGNVHGLPFIATIKGVIVHAGRIQHVTLRDQLAAFDVDTSDARLTRSLLFHRVRTPPGGNLVYL